MTPTSPMGRANISSGGGDSGGSSGGARAHAFSHDGRRLAAHQRSSGGHGTNAEAIATRR